MELQQGVILQYRNGVYQGFTRSGKRNGAGILITDSGQIYLGNWKNDQLYGQGFVQLGYEQYGFGDFNRGQLEGHFIFRKKGKALYGQFNNSRPINQLLLIDHQSSKCQVLAFKSPTYMIQRQIKVEGVNDSSAIQQVLRVRFYAPDLITYLEKKFVGDNFDIENLPNGNLLFTWNDPTNPLSLGFVVSKMGIIVNYGMFENTKLNGIGCKYENNIRYEGIFSGGFMNGMGLKFSKGKYSFGRFQEGNLVEAIHLQQRSDTSEHKLQQLKRLYHVKSINFVNSYIRHNLLKFVGFSQIVFDSQIQQEYLYSRNITKGNPKNLALQFINQKEDYETKSNKSYLNFKNPQDEDLMSERGKQKRINQPSFKRINN